ncbi:hypothetical protein K493DRAFT_325562 [Basidiobolus meristosporus CBS 931.73]|uniref:Extracellular metalloproteinase n=1 Tax=Basidiobolus meristosporus CBS 931.73 TaxID=1314790 RepID=A0A1Y1Y0M2_9FUNG|nr:hypothetical protein K493DRAFT_325562 [Basidiobolus meristosporus CBS 931.73]|eukprot:ORX91540.1 hypothetical protein K493DRAFT_325562 [Basidiobolus meristosporus CBS 931.73]
MEPSNVVKKFIQDTLSLKESDYVVKNMYQSEHNGATHVYLRQIVHGLEVVNGDMNINLDKYGRVVSYGDSFYKGLIPPTNKFFDAVNKLQDNFASPFGQVVFRKLNSFKSSPQPTVPPRDALLALAEHLKIEVSDVTTLEVEKVSGSAKDSVYMIQGVPFTVNNQVPTSLAYIQTSEGELHPVWDFQVEMNDNWYHAHVSAENAQVMSLIDWVSDAHYNVYPLGINDPDEGSRRLVSNPENKRASPLGWHSLGRRNFSTTIGNNVAAHENIEGGYEWETNYRPHGGDHLLFDFTLDLHRNPKSYLDSSITNLFYWNNVMHDLSYQYGFTETAGNFQDNNFGRGGESGDAVIANAQDGSGYNNANFATPPDGMKGKMRMYVWNVIQPHRDGDLESGIMIHEYTHGISTRLTGGPANSGCLGWGEAGGMGEGWGDFFATILRMRPDDDRRLDLGMGEYANGGKNIRYFKYSTNNITNPETYSIMDKANYWGVHAKGGVWAEMLYEMYWNLVDKYGFTSDWYSASLRHGNTLALQLVLDGMKLQPCRPKFVDARDAIIHADDLLTGGENYCEIWKAFAKRGLGLDAKLVGGFSLILYSPDPSRN